MLCQNTLKLGMYQIQDFSILQNTSIQILYWPNMNTNKNNALMETEVFPKFTDMQVYETIAHCIK